MNFACRECIEKKVDVDKQEVRCNRTGKIIGFSDALYIVYALDELAKQCPLQTRPVQ